MARYYIDDLFKYNKKNKPIGIAKRKIKKGEIFELKFHNNVLVESKDIMPILKESE